MEKTILDPKEDLYWKQYDRLVDQQREEVKELYWLHNFFFVIESAIFLLFLRGDLKRLPPIFVEVFGVIISLTWWLVCWKQKRWTFIQTLDKKIKGYVQSQYLWSPVYYRMVITKEDGVWKITSLVAGD
jgi:hypothetical protein